MEQVDQSVARDTPWPTVAALLFAAAVAAATGGLPSRRFLSWSELWGAAVVRVLAVSISAIIAAWAFSALSQLQSRRIIVGAFLNAIWLAPLALLVREHSMWAVVIAAILAVLATQSIRAFGPAPANPEESLLFSLRPDNLPLTFKHAPQVSTTAALSAQAGILAAFAGYSFVAAILVGIGFVAWTWS